MLYMQRKGQMQTKLENDSVTKANNNGCKQSLVPKVQTVLYNEYKQERRMSVQTISKQLWMQTIGAKKCKQENANRNAWETRKAEKHKQRLRYKQTYDVNTRSETVNNII